MPREILVVHGWHTDERIASDSVEILEKELPLCAKLVQAKTGYSDKDCLTRGEWKTVLRIEDEINKLVDDPDEFYIDFAVTLITEKSIGDDYNVYLTDEVLMGKLCNALKKKVQLDDETYRTYVEKRIQFRINKDEKEGAVREWEKELRGNPIIELHGTPTTRLDTERMIYLNKNQLESLAKKREELGYGYLLDTPHIFIVGGLIEKHNVVIRKMGWRNHFVLEGFYRGKAVCNSLASYYYLDEPALSQETIEECTREYANIVLDIVEILKEKV